MAITHLPEEADDAADAAAAVGGSGRGCITIEADLTERETCQEVAERAVAELGGIDVLVNNAGYQMARTESIEDVTPEQLDRVVRTNLYALFWLTQAVVPHLQPGSCVINNFTVNLAAELGPRGIRVNAVAPGPIWTPLQPATQPVEKVESFGQNTPLGRAGQPAEVAPAFVFLASPADASYVSASILGVTGGKPTF